MLENAPKLLSSKTHIQNKFEMKPRKNVAHFTLISHDAATDARPMARRSDFFVLLISKTSQISSQQTGSPRNLNFYHFISFRLQVQEEGTYLSPVPTIVDVK